MTWWMLLIGSLLMSVLGGWLLVTMTIRDHRHERRRMVRT